MLNLDKVLAVASVELANQVRAEVKDALGSGENILDSDKFYEAVEKVIGETNEFDTKIESAIEHALENYPDPREILTRDDYPDASELLTKDDFDPADVVTQGDFDDHQRDFQRAEERIETLEGQVADLQKALGAFQAIARNEGFRKLMEAFGVPAETMAVMESATFRQD